MAKAQKRSSKEAKKPKAADKAPKAGPKYMAATNLADAAKNAVSRANKNK